MFHNPDTSAVMALHVLLTFLSGILVCSFAEHAIHRHIMHRMRLPAWIYRIAPDLRVQFKNHAVLHHRTYYKQFDYEPSAEGKFFNLRILPADTVRLLLVFLPILLGLGMFVSPVSMMTLAALIVGQNQIWGLIHVQMHVPETNRWFRNTAYFHFVARHHFMHHQRVNRNYNVVLPLADFLIGSVAKPCLGDVREMLRLGYLKPRTETGRRLAQTVRVRAAVQASKEGVPPHASPASQG